MYQSDIETLFHCTEIWRFRSAQHRYVAASHVQQLRILFQWLSDASLVINSKKCILEWPLCSFLAITWLQLRLPTCRPYSAIPDPLLWMNSSDLLCLFVPSAAKILRPLTDLLRSLPGPATALEWPEEMSAAFLAAKAAPLLTLQLPPSCPWWWTPRLNTWTQLQQRAAVGEASKTGGQPRPTTRPLTGNYGPVSPASGISAIWWRPGSSFS